MEKESASLPLMREVDSPQGEDGGRERKSLPQSFCCAKIQPPRQRGPLVRLCLERRDKKQAYSQKLYACLTSIYEFYNNE